jgi:Transmembrane protein 65
VLSIEIPPLTHRNLPSNYFQKQSGFGFMDNIVMIQAGEAIDMSLGVAFGLSTLTAAGFGQCVSDVAGFTCGGIVDAGVSKLNLPHHNLSPAQLDLKVTRTWHTFGGCVGVVTGCLLGMTCLLFMDTDRADRAKKAKELQSIFESVLVDGKTLVNAGKFD